ncbi:hypothetical protein JOF56_000873 [Kibdelosporangium banguiense]|uniref:Head-to-tail stopper n=1 Tax=Kibdelosporangium banguiense TaxID=1365924 RepID=A0ABS4T7X8_9PSEU|nr:hypothetical protein [Kibdelosporangium banguiense]MBP2320488.1 hypothetical protein [Kibdelosporangium banguiense]
MQLPHRLIVITPAEQTDEYDNPTPALDYGPAAPRRTLWGLLQPAASTEDPQPGRVPVTTSWRLFTVQPISARERVEWNGRVLEVNGEPARWSPRFGHVHYEATLTTVEG